MSSLTFKGAKIAILSSGRLLAYQRDHKPEIPFPGMWDLPGGGRENDETPMECAIRETFEEFGLVVEPKAIVWERYYPAASAGLGSYFYVAKLDGDFGQIVFGNEGQCWKIMPVDEFLSHPEAVETLKQRLGDYLSGNKAPC